MTSPQQDLERGMAFHRAGRLKEARQCYDRVLKLSPSNGQALYLVGLTCLSSGSPEQAVAFLTRSLAVAPKFPDAQLHLGKALQALNRTQEAVTAYRRASALRPDHSETVQLLASLLISLGSVDEAVALLRKALPTLDKVPELHYYLGNALRAQSHFQDAIEAYGRALQLSPKLAEGHINLGCSMQALGRTVEALAAFEKAIEIRPDMPEAWYSMGALLRECGRPSEALSPLEKATGLRPAYPEALNNRGLALLKLRREEEAVQSFQEALRLRPAYLEALSNLGNALRKLERNTEAIEAFNKALAINPSSAEVLANLGTVYHYQNQLAPAIEAYRRAIAIAPSYPDARFYLGLALLTAGALREGWDNYEYRWECVLGRVKRVFDKPAWDGSQSLQGKTLLLYAEQGIGDSLQFIRYAPLAAQRGATLVVEVQPSIHSLIAPLPGIKAVVSPGDRLPDFDFHCSLLSLPRAFSTSLESIPQTTPYLAVPAGRETKWAGLLDGDKRLKVGLVWAGNPKHLNDRSRSIPFELIERLAANPGLRFFSLQKGMTETDAALLAKCPEIADLAVHINDFGDTAALAQQLDLVISVDTSVVHLAGALGRPTWALLSFAPDWRWLLERSDSPWYPSLRLFRQPSPNDWEPVIHQVAMALAALASSSERL